MKIQLITKILLMSLGISAFIKVIGPLLPISPSNSAALIFVLSPTVLLGLYLFKN